MAISIIPETNKPLPDDFDSEEPTTFNKKVEVASATAKFLMDAGAEIPSFDPRKRRSSRNI
jgi:hypothetical protein